VRRAPEHQSCKHTAHLRLDLEGLGRGKGGTCTAVTTGRRGGDAVAASRGICGLADVVEVCSSCEGT